MATKEEEIIKATMDAVAEGGIDALTVKAIAKRIGCSDTLIFKYFHDKENLIKCCLREVSEQLRNAAAEVRDRVYQISDRDERDTEFVKGYLGVGLKVRSALLFYFAIFNSQYRTLAMELGNITPHDIWMEAFAGNDPRREIDPKHADLISMDELYRYTTSQIAMLGGSIIIGRAPANDESFGQITQILFKGMLSFF